MNRSMYNDNTNTQSLNRHLLHWCPNCRYDLNTLPDEWRCPECGCEYSRDAYVFEPTRRSLVIQSCAIPIGLVSLVAGIRLCLSNAGLIFALGLAAICISSVGLIVVLVSIDRYPSHNDALLIGRRGLRLIRRGAPSVDLTWDEVAGYGESLLGRIWVSTAPKGCRTVIPKHFLPTRADAQLFLGLLNSYKSGNDRA